MSVFRIILSRETVRECKKEVLDSQITTVLARAFPVIHAHGFALIKTSIIDTGTAGNHKYDAELHIKYTGAGAPAINVITDFLATAGAPAGWSLNTTLKEEGSENENELRVQPSDVVSDCAVDLGPSGIYFKHLFERDPQISVVLSAVDAAYGTNFTHRFHTVLEGPPGCGKTAITAAVEDMIGEENVLKFDGPSCTKAGLENFFLGDDILGPKVMIFEEIEKAEVNAHKVLLSLLDSRAEVRKTTGNDGQMVRDVKVLCLATVNNMDLFRKLYAGALASRFTHTVHCPRPSRSCLEQILVREVTASAGNIAWVQPTLDFVLNVEQTTDPRRAIAVCLSGRDKLLDGSYQRALSAIAKTRKD